MSTEIKAPVFPESVAEGTVATWHKQPGEACSRDDLIVDIETDKVVLEVVAPADGVIEEIVKNEGDTVESGEVVGKFKEGAVGDAGAADAKADAKADSDDKAEPKTEESTRSGDAILSPAARKLAEENNVDPGSVKGTGKDGRVTKEDVQNHVDTEGSSGGSSKAAAPAATPEVNVAAGERIEKRVPMTRLRASIAKRLVNAQQTAAMLTTFNEVDMGPIMELRKQYQESFVKRHDIKLGFMSFFAKAATEALKRFPAVNASIDSNDMVYHGYQDIGVAVSTDRGLVVPVIRDVDALGLADIVDNTIVPNDKEVTFTKEEGLVENPILLSKVIERNQKKIGYIMYNGFVANYDDELNEVFAELKGQGASELILDFRYNPGGRVSSAIQIASAVYGTKTDELFLKARYNDKIQSDFTEGQGESNFTDETFDSGTPLTTLELDRVYVITTGGTASSSELVINGLEPYIDVVQVGTTTVGKNEFSVTFVDDPENDFFYDPERESFINPDNQWAIQPLLGRNENADGFSDYTAGLVPDFELREDVANLGVLGEESDPLLALTLSQIFSETGKFSFDPVLPVNFVTSSQLSNAKGSGMLMDGLTKADF